jgi:hypothetical protein
MLRHLQSVSTSFTPCANATPPTPLARQPCQHRDTANAAGKAACRHCDAANAAASPTPRHRQRRWQSAPTDAANTAGKAALPTPRRCQRRWQSGSTDTAPLPTPLARQPCRHRDAANAAGKAAPRSPPMPSAGFPNVPPTRLTTRMSDWVVEGKWKWCKCYCIV